MTITHKVVYEFASEGHRHRHFVPVPAIWHEVPADIRAQVPSTLSFPKDQNPHDVAIVISYKTVG